MTDSTTYVVSKYGHAYVVPAELLDAMMEYARMAPSAVLDTMTDDEPTTDKYSYPTFAIKLLAQAVPGKKVCPDCNDEYGSFMHNHSMMCMECEDAKEREDAKEWGYGDDSKRTTYYVCGLCKCFHTNQSTLIEETQFFCEDCEKLLRDMGKAYADLIKTLMRLLEDDVDDEINLLSVSAVVNDTVDRMRENLGNK